MEYISAMGISPSIIIPILILAGILAAFTALLWLLFKATTRLYGWLAQRKFLIEFNQRRQMHRENVSRKRKMPFGEFLAEVFAEPVILTIAVVILYDHLRSIWTTSPNFAAFWFRINENTRGNVLVAVFLCVALVLWMVVIMFRLNREAQRDKAFEELQKANTDQLARLLKTSNDELKGVLGEAFRTSTEQMREIAESIKELAKEIRKNREDKGGKSPTGM
jgi:methyl-accepting chemotaxis protein